MFKLSERLYLDGSLDMILSFPNDIQKRVDTLRQEVGKSDIVYHGGLFNWNDRIKVRNVNIGGYRLPEKTIIISESKTNRAELWTAKNCLPTCYSLTDQKLDNHDNGFGGYVPSIRRYASEDAKASSMSAHYKDGQFQSPHPKQPTIITDPLWIHIPPIATVAGFPIKLKMTAKLREYRVDGIPKDIMVTRTDPKLYSDFKVTWRNQSIPGHLFLNIFRGNMVITEKAIVFDSSVEEMIVLDYFDRMDRNS